MEKLLIEARGLTKAYKMGRGEAVLALRGADLSVPEGDFVSIIGASGSGKSTILHMLGFMDRPTAGELLWESRLVTRLTDAEMTRIRSREVGFVFQTFNLIGSLTAWENVALPAELARLGTARQRRQRALELLDMVGLGERAGHRPSELSGGQRQRVAIARALMNKPKLLLADEPTGNLDSATGAAIVSLLKQLNAGGQTVVLVTHNPEVAAQSRSVYRMRDGALRRVVGSEFLVAD